jgi:spermidine/putrescine transport system permease protein
MDLNMQANKSSKLLILGGIFTFLFLYVPLILVILYSFNDSRIGISWVGFTLKWYKVLFADSQLMSAAVNSLIIAFVASFFSVILGTFAGVALHKYKVPLLSSLIMIPVAAPELLVGVALLLFFLLINFTLGYVSIVLAHIAFCTSFVTLAVKSRMVGIDNSIFDAARDLGANSFKSFYLVLIP